MSYRGESKPQSSLMAAVGDFGRMFRYLALSIVQRWYVVLITLVVCMVLAVGFSRSQRPQYSSSMIVVPAQSGQQALGRAAQLGALSSSLSAFGLGGIGGSSQFQTYMQLLQSPSVAAAIMNDGPTLSGLYAGSVDAKTGNYVSGPGRLKTAMYELFALSPSPGPTVEEVQQRLNTTLVVITSSENTNIATISCTSTIQSVCPSLLLFVHRATEAQLSQVTLNDATRMAAYIQQELPHVQQEEVRSALLDLLSNAVKQMAISKLHQAVGAVIVSPPYKPVQPAFPKPTFIIRVAAIAGLIAGCFMAWLFAETKIDARVRRQIQAWSGRPRAL